MISGCYYPSILLLGFAVPHRSQSPFHQRHHLFLGMVQRGVHFGNLWDVRLGLAIHICQVLQPGHPCLTGQSPFCLISNLMGSLDQHCSSPSFIWSIQTTWTPGINLRDDTQAMDDPMTCLCLLCSIDSPGSYSHVSLGFESFQQHSTAWLYLFPYKHLRRSTSEISKGNVLGYYRNLDSLERVLHSWPCNELHSSVASFEEIWDAAKWPLI